MARKHHTSESRSSRTGRNGAAAQRPKSSDEIIERERLRLMKANAILGCVQRAMESDGRCGGDAPYWPAAIEAACDLINEAITRLEDLGYAGAEVPSEVREKTVVYHTPWLH